MASLYRVPISVFRTYSALLMIILAVSSCSKEDKAEAVKPKTSEDPSMSANNIDVLFSDSGKVQARIKAPLLNEYSGKDPRTEFPKGFHITVFDSLMRPKSTITALRGIRYNGRGYMEANGKVVVRNEQKNEQLNTEHLVWDERNHRIYNNEAIKVTTPGKILYGNNLESDESFTRYSFKNPTGQMMVKKDSL